MGDLQSVLLECEYFPCIDWFTTFVQADQVLIEQYENFERASFRNRCYVAGPNGRLALSVPVEGGRNQRAVMKDLRISYHERWQHQHLKTLEACYGRAPYYDYVMEALYPIFEQSHIYLLDLNLLTVEVLQRLMKTKQTFQLSSNYQIILPTHFTDYRHEFGIRTMHKTSAFTYLQPFSSRHGFIDGLSTLDLLFCNGLRAIDYLDTAQK